MHMIYVQMNDTYVLVFLPFLVLCSGIVIRRSPRLPPLRPHRPVVPADDRPRFSGHARPLQPRRGGMGGFVGAPGQGCAGGGHRTIPQWLQYHGEFTQWEARAFAFNQSDRDERIRLAPAPFTRPSSTGGALNERTPATACMELIHGNMRARRRVGHSSRRSHSATRSCNRG